SAATMSHRKLPVVVAAIDPVLRLQKRLVGLVGGHILLVIDHGFEAKRLGLWSESLNCHYRFSPYSIIFSPSRSVTYAFFQSGRYPLYFPRRRIFPGTTIVRTASTLTLNKRSTASWICRLLASSSTSKQSV